MIRSPNARTNQHRRPVLTQLDFAVAEHFELQRQSHLALSESFKQMAKNGWQIDDRAAIERNWRLAIDAARSALVIDPQDAYAGSEATDLQNRLDRFLASKSEL
jgi:hypothetical protein